MKKWSNSVKWTLGIVAVLAFTFFIIMLPPITYFPHKKPVLILPFDPKYDYMMNGLLPMGEKMIHKTAPDGHPGIDFGFEGFTTPVPYIASMDGTVTKVRIFDNKDVGKSVGEKEPLSLKEADVVITNGPYQTVYSEMDAASLPKNIKKGYKIKQGETVGYGNLSGTGGVPKYEMVHWEFGSITPLIDRFCPLAYFTPESDSRIEAIWAKQTPEAMNGLKAQYPKICNEGFDGKVEK